MSGITPEQRDALIAEAREAAPLALTPEYQAGLLRRLADALEAASVPVRPQSGITPESFKIAPFGGEVDRDAVREVWETFIRPTQAADAPPQSIETRTLMAILRGVYGMLPPTEREPEAPSSSVLTETVEAAE